MLETIRMRTSIRSYENKEISNSDKIIINKILDSMKDKLAPFNNQVRFFFVDNHSKVEGNIGTYGFVKNPPAFIGGIVNNTKEGMIDFGFLFEEVILELTKAGFGTVWLGGTFNRNDLKVKMVNNEIIAAVSPVGFSAKKSIREKIIREMTKADKRKPFNDLFFLGTELLPIDESHQYYKYLNAVQIAPSASNKQPWRIVLLDDDFHLYLERTKGYGEKLKFDIQAIDIGIALSHLYLTLMEDKYTPVFSVEKPIDFKNWEYIISIKV